VRFPLVVTFVAVMSSLLSVPPTVTLLNSTLSFVPKPKLDLILSEFPSVLVIDTFWLPSKLTEPVKSPSKLIVLDVSKIVALAAIPLVSWLPSEFTPGRLIFAEPSNPTPPIVTEFASFVAVEAFPLRAPIKVLAVIEEVPVKVPLRVPPFIVGFVVYFIDYLIIITLYFMNIISENNIFFIFFWFIF